MVGICSSTLVARVVWTLDENREQVVKEYIISASVWENIMSKVMSKVQGHLIAMYL